MTSYRILIPDSMLGMGLQWPEGVRLVRPLERGTVGTHWHLLEDPEAPAELEGREVSLVMARDGDGLPVIRERHVIATHLSAPDGGLRCCPLAPWDVPAADRVTWDAQAATCEGDRAQVAS